MSGLQFKFNFNVILPEEHDPRIGCTMKRYSVINKGDSVPFVLLIVVNNLSLIAVNNVSVQEKKRRKI